MEYNCLKIHLKCNVRTKLDALNDTKLLFNSGSGFQEAKFSLSEVPNTEQHLYTFRLQEPQFVCILCMLSMGALYG